jgi:hypothetical protein
MHDKPSKNYVNGRSPGDLELGKTEDKKVHKDSLDVADLLEDLARQARDGKILTVAMVTVSAAGAFSISFTRGSGPTSGLMEAYIGADVLKGTLLQVMSGRDPRQVPTPQQQSRILRPGVPLPPGMFKP